MRHKLILEILEDNNWRDGEFARIKSNNAQIDEEFWCRICIPLIYAHWEGFVVNALKSTLSYFNKLELQPHELETSFLVLGLGDCYQPLSGKQSFAQRITFTERYAKFVSATVRFPTKINTKSNLNASVLEELCEMFSFDFELFGDVVGDINMLVHVRNSIAHGENSVIPKMENITKYLAAVTAAMDILLSQIESCVSAGRFRKQG